MSKKKRSRTKSRRRHATSKPACKAQLTPEPRPHFHYELRAERSGDYEIQFSLIDEADGAQSVQARVRPPDGQAIEVERQPVSQDRSEAIVSDARINFGIPAGLSSALIEEMLWNCRKWVHQEDARLRAEKKGDER